MGGDHPVEKVPLRHAVSTHAPAWGATRARRTSSSGASRFNSRPRMGGDWATSTASTPRPVSTHAPAWGATLPSGDGDHDVLVSTHAPAWGATDEFTAKAPGQRFQLTPPHGGRRRSPPLHLRASCFNSRPRMGGDSMNEAINELLLFQLTPPHGGRPIWPKKRRRSKSFNSRPRMGGDRRSPPLHLRASCFNSRPRMGGDSPIPAP